ncbi:hypothetical protein [Lysinibacillus xylanilyticus]|uniref:hypothetical protein n=1 Tax=Lysinibacillus xylanilyticus TaxID=582475 RepID=UPI003D95EC55
MAILTITLMILSVTGGSFRCFDDSIHDFDYSIRRFVVSIYDFGGSIRDFSCYNRY